MKILLYGGSFDPPHLGHLEMLRAALRALHPDLTCVVPAYHSPLKGPPRTSAAHRLRMLKAMLQSDARTRSPHVRVSLVELRRKRSSFTYETLRHFRSKYPQAEIWYLIGSDSLASLPKWKHPAELRFLCRWIVGMRPREQPSGSSSVMTTSISRKFHVRRLPGTMPDISSTEIRAKFFAGAKNLPSLLPIPVYSYIQRRRLYGLKIHQDLKTSLSPERYRHTLGVSRLAFALAKTHGLDVETAALAGLLHDCGRRLSLSAMVRFVKQHRIPVSHRESIIQYAPILLHAYISAYLAEYKFKINDAEALSAVRNHTLGEVGMPEMDRLLYVADSASEDRGFPKARRIRRLAYKNITAGLIKAIETKKEYVIKNDGWLHPKTEALRAWARRL